MPLISICRLFPGHYATGGPSCHTNTAWLLRELRESEGADSLGARLPLDTTGPWLVSQRSFVQPRRWRFTYSMEHAGVAMETVLPQAQSAHPAIMPNLRQTSAWSGSSCPEPVAAKSECSWVGLQPRRGRWKAPDGSCGYGSPIPLRCRNPASRRHSWPQAGPTCWIAA